MVLDPLQDRIVRIALALPEARSLALAGGGVMLAQGFIDRRTRGIDLFTDRDNGEAVAVAAACASPSLKPAWRSGRARSHRRLAAS